MGMETDAKAVPIGVIPLVAYNSTMSGASGGLNVNEMKFGTATFVNVPVIPTLNVCANA
jgi:hypothetical protein